LNIAVVASPAKGGAWRSDVKGVILSEVKDLKIASLPLAMTIYLNDDN
jgi:hypothetical protein